MVGMSEVESVGEIVTAGDCGAVEPVLAAKARPAKVPASLRTTLTGPYCSVCGRRRGSTARSPLPSRHDPGLVQFEGRSGAHCSALATRRVTRGTSTVSGALVHRWRCTFTVS